MLGSSDRDARKSPRRRFFGRIRHMRQATLCLLVKENQKDKEILLAMKKRGFGKGRWNGVGGKVDSEKGDKSIISAAIRETQEEIGVKIKKIEKVALLKFRFPYIPENERKEWDQDVHVFLARTWEGEPIETEEMALTAASIELGRRATIVQRIKVDFLDEYDAGSIEIGDNVTLAILYGDSADNEIDESVRIVKLTRTFSRSGEQVSAECVNFVKANEFYNYLVSVNDLAIWL